MPVYDPHSMGITAGQVDKLKDEFHKSKGKVTGVEGDNPFGTMGGSEDVHGAMGSFKSGVHKEFEAGAAIMSSLSETLRRAAGLLVEADHVSGQNVTVHDPRNGGTSA